jgi:hypothetical protein
MGFPN